MNAIQLEDLHPEGGANATTRLSAPELDALIASTLDQMAGVNRLLEDR